MFDDASTRSLRSASEAVWQGSIIERRGNDRRVMSMMIDRVYDDR